MDFNHSERSLSLQDEMRRFLDEEIYPAEALFHEQESANRAAGTPFRTPEVLGELKTAARKRGLWNLFLPKANDGEVERGAGLSVLDYAPIAELSGRSGAIAPEAMNCNAPDTGNMELLTMFATDEQTSTWLEPLLEGEIRSCFSMTEPDVASSDATNIATTVTRDGDSYVINGRKWWSTGAMRPECKVSIVMGVSDPDAGKYQRHSMILVPLDTPGVTIERSTTVYGYDDGPHGGHGVIHFDGVRVPATNLLGPQGGGFMMAQARLGPGRIHHCMRSLGMAERALELMVLRATRRTAFGGPVASQGIVQEWIAESRLALNQARLLVLNAAWLIDTVGASKARTEIAAIKVAAPRAASYVLDRAVQVHGAAGVDHEVPLAAMWAQLRTLHLADGPDEVHLRSLAREELRRVPNHVRAVDLRTRVLDAAVELFAQQGYEGTSVSQVVNAAGVAKGGFYHHFASKQDLLYEVYGDLITRQLSAMTDILARGLPAADTLRLLIDDLVRSTAASARQALVFWREMHRLEDDRAEQYRRARRRYHDAVRKIVRDGQASGEFATIAAADIVTFTIFGVVNELPLWYRPTGRKRPAQIATELADFVLAGLAPSTGPSADRSVTGSIAESIELEGN